MGLTDPDPFPTDPDEWLRRETALQRLRDHGVARIHGCGSGPVSVETLELFAAHLDLPPPEREAIERRSLGGDFDSTSASLRRPGPSEAANR
ncbi:hypothetical protein ACIBSV_09670 [Embleya sp. NPDC050154]|uniref:hypothetical protein n=1 Tax=unclassified Embleya TaxID=2699296 RepID=UPI0037B09462